MKYEIRYIKNVYGDSTLKASVNSYKDAKRIYNTDLAGFICREDGKVLKRYTGKVDTYFCYKEGENFVLNRDGFLSVVPAGIVTQKGVRDFLRANSENKIKVIFE